MRYFNTEGRCKPEEHYMVRLDDRLAKIKKQYIDRGKYFVINRGRQYGKTTTLMALAEYLKEDYAVLAMDFQRMSTSNFADEQTFVVKFIAYMEKLISRKADLKDKMDEEAFRELSALKDAGNATMDQLFDRLSRVCETARRPVVLMIDEVDSASNHQVFIDFLAMLRGYYLDRENFPTFYSVILAGVYDIKNLKRKMRPDDDHQYNSPWNIAAKFHVAMSFSADQIVAMLAEYEADHHTGMEVEAVAEEIYQYTSGYPYLVSAIGKYLDEELLDQGDFEDVPEVWTKRGIAEAVKLLLNERTPLFDSMMRHINEYPELKEMLYTILFCGKQVAYNPDNSVIGLARMFGYIASDGTNVQVANRFFEIRLYNYFLSEEELTSTMSSMAKRDRSQFIVGGRLNMELVLEKFAEYFHDIYGDNDDKFIENSGRKLFLLYLRPIINGTGNYYIEAQTRDARRTDVVIDYRGEQLIVELKIWRGNEYHERGEQQLIEYLDYFHQKKGYMLSFSFNKRKEVGVRTITLGDRVIVEATV